MMPAIAVASASSGTILPVALSSAVVCITHDVAWATVGGDDGRGAAGECFEDHVAEGVGVGGKDEDIHGSVGAGQVGSMQDSGEFCVRHTLAERLFFSAVADDEEAEVGVAHGKKLVVNRGEETDIFLYRETADEAEDDGFVVQAALTVFG